MSIDSESEDLLRGSQDLFDRSPGPDSVIVISSDSEAGSTEKYPSDQFHISIPDSDTETLPPSPRPQNIVPTATSTEETSSSSDLDFGDTADTDYSFKPRKRQRVPKETRKSAPKLLLPRLPISAPSFSRAS